MLKTQFVRLLIVLCCFIAVRPAMAAAATAEQMSLPAAAEEFNALAREFWSWRSAEMPFGGDDIPRLERPTLWHADWSPAAVAGYKQDVAQFEQRWHKLQPAVAQWPVPAQVDYRLIGSAIARAHWELNITRMWQRHPGFYVDQTLGAVLEPLLLPPPFAKSRAEEVLRRLQTIPGTLADGQKNLSEPRQPFARLAINTLEDIQPKLSHSMAALRPELAKSLSPAQLTQFDTATKQAGDALAAYATWLQQRLPNMRQETAVGREGYTYFLHHVALLPYSPEDLLAMARQEWERTVAFGVYEEHRNTGLPQLGFFPDTQTQMQHEVHDEAAIRKFLEAHGVMSVPGWVQHYAFLPQPAYLDVFDGVGELDDFTSASRLTENCTRYVTPPSPNAGYFGRTMAQDPRPLIVHEGVPGHYFQLARSWANPDPIRRHYYDSSANEGIGFYAEEMMLNNGLFDDSPRTREIIYSFARLRALRVEVDVKLALGEFSVEQAADYLKTYVPMDALTAGREAALFSATPGQAISYQIGKRQVLKFLADSKRKMGDNFSQKEFHDFVWVNGNVPIALQRWEYLGLKDEVDALDGTR